jgi:hypothetical protein
MSTSRPVIKTLAVFSPRLGSLLDRRRNWRWLSLALFVGTSTGCIRFRNDLPGDGGVDSGATVDAIDDAVINGEGGDAVVIPPPVCEGLPAGIAEEIAGDLISELVADCKLRRHFLPLPPIAITRLQECLAAQIGQVMGCKFPNGEPYRYPTTDSKGSFCRDMKSSHMGLSSSDGDFDAFIADLNTALESNGLSMEAKMRVAGIFGATRNDIVRIKDAGPTLPCDAPDAAN